MLLDLYGIWYKFLLISHHFRVYIICLMVGYMVWIGNFEIKSLLEHVLFVGPFGFLEMIRFLTTHELLLLCR